MRIIGKYPSTRLRRVRNSNWMRKLISENELSSSDLILPLFVTEGKNKVEKINSMEGVFRYSVDKLNKIMNEVSKYNIPMVAIFPFTSRKKKDNLGSEALNEDNNELAQALETIKTLKSELNEVNILNSKLLYVNKIFKSNDLSESQKVNIIAAFDKAETVKEVKLVYETVSDSVVSKKEANNTIKESKTKLGMASKATGTTASKPEVINEVSDTVRRMQKLAGIIK